MMFFSGELIRARQAYSVVVLPDPVGPVARMMPWLWRISRSIRRQVLAGEAQPIEVEIDQRLRAIEQAQHDPLAEGGRDGRDADIDIAARHAQPDTSVLRQALLGDVEARHDLDARGDRRLKTLGRRDHVVQHAVDAEAHQQFALERLDVDVACAVLDRLREQPIDQLDDRRGVVGIEQIERFLGQLVGDHVEPILFEIDHQVLRGRGGGLIVRAVDRLIENFERHDHRMYRHPEQHAQVVERLVVGRVGDRDGHAKAVAAERQDAIFLGVIDRNLAEQSRVDRMLVDVRLEGQPVFLGDRARQTLRLQRTHVDQHVGQVLPGLFALAGALEILLGYPRAIQKN